MAASAVQNDPAGLLDQLIRARQERGRHLQSERLRRLEIVNTSSKLVGRSTGRSAGFAPFKILSKYVAARRCMAGRLGPPAATRARKRADQPGRLADRLPAVGMPMVSSLSATRREWRVP